MATFEVGLAATWSVVSAAGLDALVSLARRLAGSRARTASQPLAIPMRSRSRSEVVEADSVGSEFFTTFWFVCHSLFLYRRHFYEMTHVFDLSA